MFGFAYVINSLEERIYNNYFVMRIKYNLFSKTFQKKKNCYLKLIENNLFSQKMQKFLQVFFYFSASKNISFYY